MRLFPILGCNALALALVLALAAPGCGSGGGASGLTCDWLQGPNNCWKNTALTATTCLPAQSEQGTFSADGSTCTYASGSVVTFTPPLTLPLPTGAANMKWNFTITDANGQACLHYADTGSALTLTVQGQTVTEGSSGGLGIQIHCPDGTTVGNSNAFDLFNCPDSGNIDLPGLVWSSSGSGSPPFNLSTGLTGTGDSSVPLFSCATP